jgi:hypothetical protein
MGVWHKPKPSILSNFSPYISIFSGRGSARLCQSGCARPKVGVARDFRAYYIYFHLGPAVFSHKLGNYADLHTQREGLARKTTKKFTVASSPCKLL